MGTEINFQLRGLADAIAHLGIRAEGLPEFTEDERAQLFAAFQTVVDVILSAGNRLQAAPHTRDTLDVRCWCQSTTVAVPADDVKRGLTGSCGRPACKKPAEVPA